MKIFSRLYEMLQRQWVIRMTSVSERKSESRWRTSVHRIATASQSHKEWKEVPAAQVSCGPAFTHTALKPNWLSTSSNPLGGGGHQASMGRGVINQLWGGGHQPSMGRGVINQVWGVVPSCSNGGWGYLFSHQYVQETQNPQNYFSNTYVLPSVNRTAGPKNVALQSDYARSLFWVINLMSWYTTYFQEYYPGARHIFEL